MQVREENKVTSPAKKNRQPSPVDASHGDLDALKRDMRSAHLAAWTQKNQQKIIAGVAALLLVIVGVSLWREHTATQRASAATLYYQALNVANVDAKSALLAKVVKDYSDTAYAGLAQILLAKVDRAHDVQHLTALLAHGAPDREMAWQARLDLAQAYLRKNEKVKAKSVLAKSMGADYEQLRHYLMAEIADNNTDRISYLKQALGTASHDAVLRQRIKKRLAELKDSSSAGAPDS